MRILTCLLALPLLCALRSHAQAPERFFEPEDGSFSFGEPDPYHLVLRELLVGADRPTCGLVVIPSFKPEWSVGIVTSVGGKSEIVSRRFKRSLWARMFEQLEKGGDEGGVSLLPPAQTAALRELRKQLPAERRASIDKETASRLTRVCERVLLNTRYAAPERTVGLDGTTFHAIHWAPGKPLAGVAWSPPANTVAALFTQLGSALASFAEAQAEDRSGAQKVLLEAADRLVERLDAGQ